MTGMFQFKFSIDGNGDFAITEEVVNGKTVEVVSYKKAYFTEAYDRAKYMSIFAKLKALAIKYKKPSICNAANPYRIQKLCYIRESGIIKSMGDEKHIFRYKTLQKLHSKIFEHMPLFLDQENSHLVGDIICYPDEKQAEIEGTWKLPIKQRIKLHIQLLRQLRKKSSVVVPMNFASPELKVNEC
jgi:hypothetical protein